MLKRMTVIALLLFAAGDLAAQDLTKIDFTLRDLKGNDVSFQKYLDKVREDAGDNGKACVMISFWAMWCQPCKFEMKSLRGMYDRYHEKGLHYIAINMDNPKSLSKVAAYVSAEGIPYDVWSDPNSEVFKKLNGQIMPYSLIVDKDGKLISKRQGFIAGEEKEIEADVRKVLE
jgi:cytochrome c biogenesis protein CcmG, thiol:disulfide interchange protein DsbE